jgi:hypothetical protein
MNGCPRFLSLFGREGPSYLYPGGDPDLRHENILARWTGRERIPRGGKYPFSIPSRTGREIQAAGPRARSSSHLWLVAGTPQLTQEELRTAHTLSYAKSLLRYGEGYATERRRRGVAGIPFPESPYLREGRFAAALSRRGSPITPLWPRTLPRRASGTMGGGRGGGGGMGGFSTASPPRHPGNSAISPPRGGRSAGTRGHGGLSRSPCRFTKIPLWSASASMPRAGPRTFPTRRASGREALWYASRTLRQR